MNYGYRLVRKEENNSGWAMGGQRKDEVHKDTKKRVSGKQSFWITRSRVQPVS